MQDLIKERFVGRDDIVAVGTDTGFRPYHLDKKKGLDQIISEHLSGKRCAGFYLLRNQSYCRCSCLDFDDRPEYPDERIVDKTQAVSDTLVNLHVDHLVEISQSGRGRHVWLFFEKDLPAKDVRDLWKNVCREAGIDVPEIYPRQDQTDNLGNLIRYPLWGRSRFVGDVGLADVRQHSLGFVHDVIRKTGGVSDDATTLDVSTQIRNLIASEYSLLGRRWRGDTDGMVDKSQSSQVLSLACEFIRQYIPTDDCRAALVLWCEQNGYERDDRWLDLTIDRAYRFVVQRREAKSRRSTTLLQAARKYVDLLESGKQLHRASGIAQLDSEIDGVGVGEVCIVAGPPSHCKSSFALNWAHTVAKTNVPVLLMSEEMSDIEIGKRVLQIGSLSGSYDEVRAKLQQKYDQHAPIYLVENCATIDRVEKVIESHVSLNGVGLVCLDYLQLLGSQGGSRYEQVSDVSRRIKQCARRHDVPILLLSQLNRDAQKRPGWWYCSTDLRESGQIEQDADMILFTSWPWKDDPRQPIDRFLIQCTKRRNGPYPAEAIEISFDCESQTFA